MYLEEIDNLALDSNDVKRIQSIKICIQNEQTPSR